MEVQGGNDDNTSLRVASFSCYLDNSLHKISAQRHYPPNLRLDTTPPFNVPPPAAENYFSMKLDYKTSEPSSRNTQIETKHQKNATKRRIFFSGFGCKGPCFNRRKDVVEEVEEETSSHCVLKAPTQTKSARIIHHEKIKSECTVHAEINEEVANMEESRRSIEVFGSGTSVLRGGEVAKNMERKLSMLTWDAIPKVKNLPTSSIGSFRDDVASEASSDLFEIENISELMHPVLRDDVSMSPTSSYYAPSEASIQWSVITGSTADYPNSDYNEPEGVDLNSGGGGAKERRNGGILGCRSLGAVDAVETREIVSRKMDTKARNSLSHQQTHHQRTKH